MPDIAMCEGHECPNKTNCYRFMAKAEDYQTYILEPPFEYILNEGQNAVWKCDYYWKIKINVDESN
jgi:hypothetical protein